MSQANLIIVMGVSGCGKTTLAKALADQLSYRFIEADDFHSEQNKAQMAAGRPLTDDMREPWINSLIEHLEKCAEYGQHSVLSYSGLKADHRVRFRALPMSVHCLYLQGSEELIAHRIKHRREHFMPASLLSSQLKEMQDPSQEPNTHVLDTELSIKELLRSALSTLNFDITT